jgi:hypothetical protein
MKIKFIIFSAASVFINSECGFTQSSVQDTGQAHFPNAICISAGSSALFRQDLIYSPFVHSDRSLRSFGLSLQRDKKLFQYLDISFSHNTSQIGEPREIEMGHHLHPVLPHEFLFISAAFGIGKAVKTTPKRKDWLGCALKADLQATFYSFVLSDMFGYLIEQSANAWYRRSYDFGKQGQLAAQIELPLLSWLARPPYLAEDDEFIENISSHQSPKILLALVEDGELAAWDKYQRVNFQVEYLYPLFKKFQIGFDFRFTFIHAREPKPLLSYHQILNLTSHYKF